MIIEIPSTALWVWPTAAYAVALPVLFFLPRKFWRFFENGGESLIPLVVLLAPLSIVVFVLVKLWLLCHPAPVPYSGN